MRSRCLSWVPCLGLPGLLALALAAPGAVQLQGRIWNAPVLAAQEALRADSATAEPVRLGRSPRASLLEEPPGASFGIWLERLPHGEAIVAAARAEGVDPLLVAAVVAEESSFRADAISPRGALGLMQVMPYHFRDGEDPFDPETNLRVGTRLLSRLEVQFDGDLARALAAYHAGPALVERRGVHALPQETRIYLERVFQRLARHHAAVVEAAAPRSGGGQREELVRPG